MSSKWTNSASAGLSPVAAQNGMICAWRGSAGSTLTRALSGRCMPACSRADLPAEVTARRKRPPVLLARPCVLPESGVSGQGFGHHLVSRNDVSSFDYVPAPSADGTEADCAMAEPVWVALGRWIAPSAPGKSHCPAAPSQVRDRPSGALRQHFPPDVESSHGKVIP